MPMMKEFDPYIKCPWCGREIHQVDMLNDKHMCEEKRAWAHIIKELENRTRTMREQFDRDFEQEYEIGP